MSAVITWHPTFSVGHPVLDQQHRILMSLCNRVSAGIEDRSPLGIEQFHLILHELSVYARTHFSTEEAMLGNCRYLLLSDHQKGHAEYEERLAGFLYDATFGTLDRQALRSYLSEWWVHHILDSDMQYKEYLETVAGANGRAAGPGTIFRG